MALPLGVTTCISQVGVEFILKKKTFKRKVYLMQSVLRFCHRQHSRVSFRDSAEKFRHVIRQVPPRSAFFTPVHRNPLINTFWKSGTLREW